MLLVLVAPLGLLPAAHGPGPVEPAAPLGRRQVAPLFLLAALPSCARPARAADDLTKLRWVSGRSDPIRKTSKDSNDGTKKDSKYLSCLNDCVPRCQGPPGAETKERGECFAECQDECCFTYQQCTYTITIR